MNNTFKQLTTDHIEYFIHWTGLLALEEAECRRGNQISNMWTKSVKMRQEMGQAICDLVVANSVQCIDELYLHVFVAKHRNAVATQNRFRKYSVVAVQQTLETVNYSVMCTTKYII